MPVDSSIYAQFMPPAKSVQDYQDQDILRETRLQALQQNQLALLGQRQKLDEYQRGVAEQGQIRNALMALGPQATDEQRIAALKGTGLPGGFSQADALQKAMLDRQNIESQARERNSTAARNEQGIAIKARQDAYAEAASLNTPEDAIAALNRAVAAGKVPMQAVPGLQRMVQTDPLWKLKLMQGALDPEKLKEVLMPHMQAAGGALVNTNPLAGPTGQGVSTAIPITQSADNAATIAAENARAAARLRQERDLQGGQVEYQTDGNGNLVALPKRVAPSTVVRAQPVVGGPGLQPLTGKDANMTEGQAKALSFGARMTDARNTLDQLEGRGILNRGSIKAMSEGAGRFLGLGTDSMGGTLADVAGSATNWTQSEDQQRYEAAKRNWIAANLRKESGAVIGAQEYRDADNQYFPQPGDGAGTIQDKRRRRQIAEQTMLAEVPQNKRSLAATPASIAAPAKPGAVMKFDANGNLVN